MKIACDSCGAKYTIADEKVSGKTVKIRCKKCGATMVIDGHGGAASQANGASAPVAVQTPDPVVSTWMIHSGEGAQETVSSEQIVERYRDGRIDGSCYVWRDGMADWKLLRDVHELFSVCVAAVAGNAAPAPAGSRPVESARRASQPPPPSESTRTQSVSLPTPSPAASVPAPAARSANGGPLTDLVAQSVTPSSAPQQQGALTGQRNDNSVLFSLASLSQGPGVVPAAPGSDQSGLIDMRALAQLAAKQKAEAPKVEDIMNLSSGGLFGGGAVSPVMTQTYQAVQANAAAAQGAQGGGDSRKAVGLAIAGGAALVILAGGGVFMAMRRNQEPPVAQPAPLAPAPVAPVAEAPPPAPPPPMPEPAKVEPAKAEPAKAAAKAPVVAAPPKAAPSKGGVSSAAAAAALFGPGGAASAPVPAAPPPPPPKAAAPSPPPSLESAMAASATRSSGGGAKAPAPAAPVAAASGAAFDRGAASAELRRIADSVSACRRPIGPNGDGHVTVTFRNDGAVDHVDVDRPPYQGTPVGACVASKFKLAHVPAFAGAPITVGKSFTID